MPLVCYRTDFTNGAVMLNAFRLTKKSNSLYSGERSVLTNNESSMLWQAKVDRNLYFLIFEILCFLYLKICIF